MTDLMVFIKDTSVNNFEDFLNWYCEESEKQSDKPFNKKKEKVNPQLLSWYNEMNLLFPSANAPEEGPKNTYSVEAQLVYASFENSDEDKIYEKAKELAKKYQLGFFNPQTGEVQCQGITICKMRTDQEDDIPCIWAYIEEAIETLKDPDRIEASFAGTFLTIWFEDADIENQSLQVTPILDDRRGLKGRLQSIKTKNKPSDISRYLLEATIGENIYSKELLGQEKILELFHSYYNSGQLPNIKHWKKNAGL